MSNESPRDSTKLRSDNGTQFASLEFALFCKDYQIDHYTSSPQSNGAAERAAQIVKRLWRKCTDKHSALLDYRTTPLESCHLSPAQLCMSRRPRHKLPIARELRMPTVYKVRRNRRHIRLSTVGADTQLAAVAPPGQSSESNARTPV
jgi:transposase InsO family protein